MDYSMKTLGEPSPHIEEANEMANRIIDFEPLAQNEMLSIIKSKVIERRELLISAAEKDLEFLRISREKL
jgi:hypothetical protein